MCSGFRIGHSGLVSLSVRWSRIPRGHASILRAGRQVAGYTPRPRVTLGPTPTPDEEASRVATGDVRGPSDVVRSAGGRSPQRARVRASDRPSSRQRAPCCPTSASQRSSAPSRPWPGKAWSETLQFCRMSTMPSCRKGSPAPTGALDWSANWGLLAGRPIAPIHPTDLTGGLSTQGSCPSRRMSWPSRTTYLRGPCRRA